MSDKPTTIRLSASEWGKLVLAIGAQLIGVVVYVQSIDQKAASALERATEIREEFRDYRDKTESKLDRIVNDVADIKAAVKQGAK